jgi:tetratricopeptide (TPR) repeat protein
MSASERSRLALFVVAVMLAVSVGLSSAEERTAFPPQARQRYEEGRALQKKGQLNEAVAAFEEAIKLGMEAYPRVHLQRASSNLGLKKFDTAIAQYSRIIDEFGLEESCRY